MGTVLEPIATNVLEASEFWRNFRRFVFIGCPS